MTTSADQDQGQPLVEHLIELRTRLLHAIIAVMLIFLPLFYFANDIYAYISEPLRVFLPEGTTMIATEVASPFLTPFKLTLVLSIFAAMPYLLHQIWSFIAPGLYASEKRVAAPLLISSIALFYSGIAFAFYVVFPLVFGFFTSVAPDGVTVMTDINRYLDFVLKLFFAFGLAFEIPIATVLLIWTGATTTTSMAGKRPYVIVGCFVVGMLLTPPDVISQILLAFPMWILFEAGIIFAKLFKLDKREEGEEGEEGEEEDTSTT
ncbi:MAG: twin-arginine translocase subunit TatC [Gammaproteobacteria bacterium]|jgi:sec-independent protein translocase protein TatC|nr:twin-arginine translocase subunit TatC [Gammaproteobacteria bacterium]MBT7372327.1 twin-arginine translocase subunit TatC [Gammaproteobacteria bacterium]